MVAEVLSQQIKDTRVMLFLELLVNKVVKVEVVATVEKVIIVQIVKIVATVKETVVVKKVIVVSESLTELDMRHLGMIWKGHYVLGSRYAPSASETGWTVGKRATCKPRGVVRGMVYR
ncbi:hypothetical protein F4860DRAFT_369139 [Xylaria cubensis]|nr:hypothetical protein F4860DRAFT_369139 [Xylaria cubensis]